MNRYSTPDIKRTKNLSTTPLLHLPMSNREVCVIRRGHPRHRCQEVTAPIVGTIVLFTPYFLRLPHRLRLGTPTRHPPGQDTSRRPPHREDTGTTSPTLTRSQV